jgi:hypothetical protein
MMSSHNSFIVSTSNYYYLLFMSRKFKLIRNANTTSAILSFNGGYTLRPKNIWKPLTAFTLTLTAADAAQKRGHVFGTEVTRNPVHRTQGDTVVHESTVSEIRISVGGREYCATLNKPGQVQKKMRTCLQGTGYKMGSKEKLFAHAAHKAGLRSDRVHFQSSR